jgi:hypothetical protein
VPISATGRSRPFSTPSVISRPSSTTKSSFTPRDLQQFGDGLGALLAADLLVVAGGDVDRLARLEAGGGQRLDRLEDGEQVGLVVPRTAC